MVVQQRIVTVKGGNPETSKSSNETIEQKGIMAGGRTLGIWNLLTTFITLTLFIIAFLGAFLSQLLSWCFLFPWFLTNTKAKILTGGLMMRLWQGWVVLINPFFRLKALKPPPPGWKPTKTVVMVNHLSSLDPWVVTRFMIPWEMKWVYKKDLEKLPLIGWSVKMSFDLSIEFEKTGDGWRTKEGSVSRMMAKCKEYLDKGVGVVVFPEGTRSRTGRLQPFKPGFFRLALDEGLEILPCVLHKTNELWPLGSHIIRPGTAYFSYGTPFKPEKGDTVESLQKKVQTQMVDMLTEMPGFDYETMKPHTEFATKRGDSTFG